MRSHTLVLLCALTLCAVVAGCERPTMPSNYRHEPAAAPAKPTMGLNGGG